MSQNAPIGVVFDFDGTLTPKEYGSLIKVVEHACLPESIRARVDKLRDAYLEMALFGPVTPAMERRLIRESLRIYVECGLARSAWKAALDNIKLRDGVSEKIRELTGRGILVGIISFSVADFIEAVLEVNGLDGKIHRVYASRLVHDTVSNRVIGWKKQSIVHPFNKCVWSVCFARQYNIAPNRLLAVGDSNGDRFLGFEKSLRLGIVRDEEEAKRLAEWMGETIVTEHFSPVGEWIDRQIRLILNG